MSDFNPEHAWDTCESGSALFDANKSWADAQVGSRKVSLLLIAHARIVWPGIVSSCENDQSIKSSRQYFRKAIAACEQAIIVCERYIDGQATDAERNEVLTRLDRLEPKEGSESADWSMDFLCALSFARYAWGGNWSTHLSPWIAESSAGRDRAIADLLREVFGNPFRPVRFDPAWRTDTAVALALHMYDSREFGAMPILADALQDAGCDSDELLNHCRSATATHVRGCWVVDLVLGKG